MTPSWPRPLVVFPLCALALGPMASCSSPAGPTTGPCEETTVFSSQIRIPANTYLVQSITMPQTGRLDVTVDWVLPTNIVSLTLAPAPCSIVQFQEDKCNVLLNLFPPPKPLVGSTYWLNAGDHDLLLGNLQSDRGNRVDECRLQDHGLPDRRERVESLKGLVIWPGAQRKSPREVLA